MAEEAKYPGNAKDNGIEGKVFVGFVINRDGTVTDVKIVRGVDKDLDNESIRVVKSMPRWKPGMQDGETVRVSYVIPINFRLDKSIKESKKRKRKEIFN